jgi:ribosomal protein S18 acetylase RimI-like enzyme
MALMPQTVSRVAVTSMTGRALDEALAFAALHPVGQLDGPTRLRLLTQLTSAPQGTIVLADARGEVALVATVLDVIAESDAPAELVILGARRIERNVFTHEVLAPAELFARSTGRRALHLSRPSCIEDVDEVLEGAGYVLAYEVILMRRLGHADVREALLPAGWRWAPLDEALVPQVHAALLEMFRGAPSTTLPPLAEFRRGAFLSPPGWHVLLDGDVVAGLVRLSAQQEHGEVRVLGRRPAYRGRGLGELLLAHGLRLLADLEVDAVTLEVAASNDGALALYRRFGFEVVERTPVYATVL